MNDLDLAWLAGLLEGEGCFTRQTSSRCPVVQVQMADRDIVERAAGLMGVKNIHTQGSRRGHKEIFQASLAGRAAVSLMVRLAPLMGSRRRERISGLVAEWEARPNQRRPFQAFASCHPQRQHVARGLCGSCWNRQYRRRAAA